MATSQDSYTHRLEMHIKGNDVTCNLTVRGAYDYPVPPSLLPQLIARTLSLWVEVMNQCISGDFGLTDDIHNLSAWQHLNHKLVTDGLNELTHTELDPYVTVWGYAKFGDSVTIHDYTTPNEAIMLCKQSREGQELFWQFANRFGATRSEVVNQFPSKSVRAVQPEKQPEPEPIKQDSMDDENPLESSDLYAGMIKTAKPIGTTHLTLPLGKGQNTAIIAQDFYNYKDGHTYDDKELVAYVGISAAQKEDGNIRIETTKGNFVIFNKDTNNFAYNDLMKDLQFIPTIPTKKDGGFNLIGYWVVFKASIGSDGKKYMNYYGMWKVK